MLFKILDFKPSASFLNFSIWWLLKSSIWFLCLLALTGTLTGTLIGTLTGTLTGTLYWYALLVRFTGTLTGTLYWYAFLQACACKGMQGQQQAEAIIFCS